MVVPWIGFELNHIIKLNLPIKKFFFESVYDPENLPGQKISSHGHIERDEIR